MNLNTHQPSSYTPVPRNKPLKFFSRPFQNRQTLIPNELLLGFGAFLSLLCFVGACYVIQHLLIIGCALMLCSWTLGSFVYIATANLINENHRRHQLILSGDLITVSLYDFTSHRKTVQHLSLRRINSAEFHEQPNKDQSTLVLRGYDIDESPVVIEIPLGAFGSLAERKVISYLKRYNVEVLSRFSNSCKEKPVIS